MSTPVIVVTTDDLLAMPEDGVERELIQGQLRERPMTRRNRAHSLLTATLVFFLEAWIRLQPRPWAEVLAGEAGFRIRRNPDTTVGIDVAYISPELASATPPDARLVEGVPVLAVEILSPSDKQEEITDMVKEYLEAGVGLVWVVDPVFRTIEVFRSDAEPELLNIKHALTAEP